MRLGLFLYSSPYLSSLRSRGHDLRSTLICNQFFTPTLSSLRSRSHDQAMTHAPHATNPGGSNSYHGHYPNSVHAKFSVQTPSADITQTPSTPNFQSTLLPRTLSFSGRGMLTPFAISMKYGGPSPPRFPRPPMTKLLRGALGLTAIRSQTKYCKGSYLSILMIVRLMIQLTLTIPRPLDYAGS